jgi:hypothetical protein
MEVIVMSSRFLAQPTKECEFVKQRLSIFTSESSFHPDNISRHGSLVVIRRALKTTANVALEVRQWRQMLAERIPQAKVLSVSVDRNHTLRARLSFPQPIVACPVCGELTEADSDYDNYCFDCIWEYSDDAGFFVGNQPDSLY